MIKVLALIGSPRKGGNSDILADEVLNGAKQGGAEIEKVYLDDFLIRPIGEVGDNSRERDDPRADDDFVKLLEMFLDADIIVWSTPVYWQGVSAQMKCFIDRLSSYFNRPPFSERFDGKGHIVLCTFGRPDDKHGKFITEPMKLTVEVLRGIYLGDICVSSCYQKGKIKEKKNVLLNAFELGKKIINEYNKIKNKSGAIS